METVVLDGVQYVKASVAAKDFKYTTDYIGQLCRARKVDARLVGRTWFVNPDSIRTHRRNRHKKKAPVKDLQQPEKVLVKALDSTTEFKRVAVASPVKTKTIKQLAEAAGISTTTTRHLSVQYEIDDESLIPTLHKRHTPPPKIVRVEPANAKKVRIVGARKEPLQFSPSEIPEVSLSGKLSVSTYNDPAPAEEPVDKAEPAEITSKNNVISDDNKRSKVEKKPVKKLKVKPKKEVKVTPKKEVSVKVKVTPTSPVKPEKVEIEPVNSFESKLLHLDMQEEQPESTTENGNPVRSTSVPGPTFTPSSVQQSAAAAPSFTLRILPLVATIVAAVCALAVFSSHTEVVVSGSQFSSGVTMQMANLLELLR